MAIPADIANQALDAIGSDLVIGDIQEGTREAQVLLRAYGQCLRQLLRACHWNFARRTASLELLGDATGQTPNVGTLVPVPWIYSYAYPIDGCKARFVPCNPQSVAASVPAGNIAIPATPIMTGLNPSMAGQRLYPARFTEATDFNYPPPPGAQDSEVQGVSPQGRTVILTNVQNAQLVYTALMLYPSVWDSLFRAAMVSYLASEVVMALQKDKKLARELRKDQIEITKQKITQARITDGNEAWNVQDIPVDWMSFRRTAGGGTRWGNGGWDPGGPGVLWYGYDQCAFGDGSAY